MIVVLSDTHGREDHRLEGRAREAVREADLVVHAGDFITESALDAFERVAPRLEAVHGNVDGAAVAERLPAVRTFRAGGARFVLVHGHEHGETARGLLGRERDADVVVSGHSHVPGVVDAGDCLLVNPGSHADPRGNPAAHAELEATDDGLRGRIVERGGATLETFVVG